VTPFIGNPNQNVLLSNTYFDPQMISLKITEHDIDSLAIGIYGNQVKNINTGVRTYLDENGDIFKQYSEYIKKDQITGKDLYEIKKEFDIVDSIDNFEEIIK
jgi:hypothetical protein